MSAVSADLFDKLLRHQVYVQRLASSDVKTFVPFLREMDRDIRDRLADSQITDFGKARLEALLNDVDGGLASIFKEFGAQLTGSLGQFAQYEAAFTADALDLAPDFESVLPSLTQISAAIRSAPLSVTGAYRGKLLKDLISDWSQGERNAVEGTIRRGAFEGKTNAQIVRDIRGTGGANFQDGLLNVTRRHADAVVRTAVQHVATVAREETLEANADIIESYEWVATLDRRTCPSCRSLDGQIYPVGKGPRPPLHINCRCALMPVLAGKYAKLMKGSTRASKGAEGGRQVSADLSYYDWLKDQPDDFQDEVLGPTRAKLFRDGGLTAARFADLQLDKNFQPMTLEEMRARNPVAFNTAGL